MLTANRGGGGVCNSMVVIKGQVSARGQELHQTGICFYALLKALKSKGTFCHYLRAHVLNRSHANTHLHTSHILTMQTVVWGVSAERVPWCLAAHLLLDRCRAKGSVYVCVCRLTGRFNPVLLGCRAQVLPEAREVYSCGRWVCVITGNSLSEASLRNEKSVCIWRRHVIWV